MEKSQPLHGLSCSSLNLIPGLLWRRLRERAFSNEIIFSRVFCVLFLRSVISPARLRAFQALSCSHLTSFAKKNCSLWIKSANAWPVGFSSNSPLICVLIRAFQSSTFRLKKTVAIRCEKSDSVVRAVLASLGKSRWGSWVHI